MMVVAQVPMAQHEAPEPTRERRAGLDLHRPLDTRLHAARHTQTQAEPLDHPAERTRGAGDGGKCPPAAAEPSDDPGHERVGGGVAPRPDTEARQVRLRDEPRRAPQAALEDAVLFTHDVDRRVPLVRVPAEAAASDGAAAQQHDGLVKATIGGAYPDLVPGFEMVPPGRHRFEGKEARRAKTFGVARVCSVLMRATPRLQ